MKHKMVCVVMRSRRSTEIANSCFCAFKRPIHVHVC